MTSSGHVMSSWSCPIDKGWPLSYTLSAIGTDLHEIFMERVEWPWDDLITFWVNSGKPRDAAMVTWQMTSRALKGQGRDPYISEA